MPDPVEQTPTQEQSPIPEKVGYQEGYVGLQARILSGTKDALDPDKALNTTAESLKQQIENQETRAASTYRLLANASTDERIKYWKKRAEKESLSSLDQQKAKWVEEMIETFKDTGNANYVEIIKKLSLGQGGEKINFESFNQDEALKLYNRYFNNTRETKPIKLKDGNIHCMPSNVVRYIDDIVRNYAKVSVGQDQKPQVAVDYAQLKNDLSAIQWFSSVFGDEYSDELITQLVDAETKMLIGEKEQELINSALKEEKISEEKKVARIDNLVPREKELLKFLQSGEQYQTVDEGQPEPPKPTPPQPPQPKPPSKPLPEGYKWRYEKPYDPNNPTAAREFPEEHLISEMTRPDVIAHGLKARDAQNGNQQYAHISEEDLAQKITTENKRLYDHLNKLELNHAEMTNIMDTAMGAYRTFIEKEYGIKLPNLGNIAIIPIWGKTAEYYHKDRQALAFIYPTVPAIFLDMGPIQELAKTLHKEFTDLTPQEFRNLITRLLNEIKPHETTHLAADLGFWYLNKQKDSTEEHEKVAVGKLGLQVAKPVSPYLTEHGEIFTKERGRGLMEAVTVELTNQWAASLHQPLDIPAYQSERRVLTALCNQLANEQGVSNIAVFKKFVGAHFTPNGFLDLTRELSGRKVETLADGSKKVTYSHPHYLEIIYALMQEEAHNTAPHTAPNYPLTMAFIHGNLSDVQKKQIENLIGNTPDYLTLSVQTKRELAKKIGITPPPEPQPPSTGTPPEPKKPEQPPVDAKEANSVKEIAEEAELRSDSNEEATLIIQQAGLSSILSSAIPFIEADIKAQTKKPIAIAVDNSPMTINFSDQEAAVKMFIKAGPKIGPFVSFSKVELNFKLKGNPPEKEGEFPETISFLDPVAKPDKLWGQNIQEAIANQTKKYTINDLLERALQKQFSENRKDLDVESVKMRFAGGKIIITVKGKKKTQAT